VKRRLLRPTIRGNLRAMLPAASSPYVEYGSSVLGPPGADLTPARRPRYVAVAHQPPSVPFALGFALFVAPLSALANPETAQRAVAARQASRTAEARTLFERALEEGGNDPAWLRAIYFELGVLRAQVGEISAAERAFAALLDLEPGVTLGPGASPVAVAALERARRARSPEPPLGLEVVGQDPTEVGWAHSATVTVHGDTTGLSSAALATVIEGPASGTSVEARGRSPYRLAFPRDATPAPGEIRYRVDVVDRYGSVLATTAERAVVVVPREDPSLPPTTPPTAHEPSWTSSPWFWGAAVVVVAGAVAGVLLLASDSRTDVGHVGQLQIR